MLFFFSSRRRHTRLVSDWSSDVCSSDLTMAAFSTRLRDRRVEPTDLGLLMRKRARLVGSTLRSRSRVEKAAIVARFREELLSSFDAGKGGLRRAEGCRVGQEGRVAHGGE